jgi:hypothetical protein
VNLTDPDSRNLKTTRGWVQGYNAQAAVTGEQIVVAAEISIESVDTANLEPMVDTARRELEAAGVGEKPGVVLADAGYWRNDAIEAIVAEGIQALVAPDADRRKEPRPGRRGGLYDFTRRVLATERGKRLYLKRQGTVEPVFGQIKSNRGANRFSRRGRSAVIRADRSPVLRISDRLLDVRPVPLQPRHRPRVLQQPVATFASGAYPLFSGSSLS